MKSIQLASNEQSPSKDSKDDRFELTVGDHAAESSDQDGELVGPNVSRIITDEVLRHRIRSVLDEKPKPSKLSGISNSPLISVVVGFVLYALIGGSLTYYHGIQQQEIARKQSFSDELNKIRIQKIGLVWEKIDKNEVTLDDLLDRINKAPGSNSEDFAKLEKLIDEDLTIINENRFWLGEPAYDQLKDYMAKTGYYASDMLVGSPGIDLSEALKHRKHAKQDILRVRSMFLRGELELNK